jgi:hypothetical protein
MKNIVKFVCLAWLFVAGCTKEDKLVVLEGGTAPVLSANVSTPLILKEEEKRNDAVKFSWTNPNYSLNTGLSSQNVSYLLQVDKAGGNFSSPLLQEVSILSELSRNFTVQDLNAILTKMDLEDNVSHNLEFRIKSTLGATAAPLLSNSLSLKITPYLDVVVPVPESGTLYVTGNATASDWTNSPPESQKMTQVSKTEYTITLTLMGGDKYIKFVSKPGNWQPQYGGSTADAGTLAYNLGGGSDPDAIPIASNGTYKITVNFKTGRYTVVKQ